ncbi:DUF488 domain-containing protein [bacterium]|jgi:uncharacterized protein (DUF488 family)|nr:DUF488 domain-containing protein [bacterium]
MVRILTTGHSTRPIETFIAMLRDAGVSLLADVRTVPRSRHNPQYESGALAASLDDAGIDYRHLPGLGGLRKPSKESINTGWRNASFRGFADYMGTPAFETALEELIALADHRQVAIMCSEGAPFRCHRSLIADALLAHGVEAAEIGAHGHLREHKRTPFARVNGTSVTYPPEKPAGPG